MSTYSESVKHRELHQFVFEMAELCEPDDIHWCDGTKEEYDLICHRLVEKGTFMQALNS